MDIYIPSDLDKSDANALAHLDLVDKSQVVIRLGKTLLACGAGAYRVKSAMARAAKAVGLDRHESQVSIMEITTTAWSGHNYRTETVEVRTVGVNVVKLDMLMVICAEIHDSMTVAELDGLLDEVDRKAAGSSYGIWATVLASAVACAGFSFLNNGRIVECTAVFFAAGIGQIIRKLLLTRHVTHFVVWISCAAASTALYIALVSLGTTMHLFEGSHQAGIISAILYIIPGFPMTTAILDFVRMDFWSAITRINYCIMVLGSAGISVFVVVHLLNWQLTEPAPEALPFWLHTSLRLITSFVAAYGFAVLFNAPWKVASVAGIIGSLANTGRILLQMNPVNLPWQISVGIAAFVIGVLATLVAWKTSHSRVSISVPAVVIMIPGVPFYKALVEVNEGDITAAFGAFSEVFLVVMGIGFGLAISRVLLDKGWLFDSNTNVLPISLEKTSHEAHF